MVTWRVTCSDANGNTRGPDVTRFYTLFGRSFTQTLEAFVEYEVSRPYTLSEMYLRVTVNAATTASPVRPRVNGLNVNQLITVPAATTGAFEDLTNSDELAVDDSITIQFIYGSGGAITHTILSFNLTADESQPPVGCSGSHNVDADEIEFYPMFSTLDDQTDVSTQYLMRFPATLTDFQVNVAGNGIPSSSTCAVRLNGSDSALTITIPATTSGIIKNVINEVSVSPGDNLNFRLSTGGGGSNLAVVPMTVLMTGNKRPQGVCDLVGFLFDENTSRFFPIEGGATIEATELLVQVRAGVDFTATNLLMRVTFNPLTSASTVGFRVNGAFSALQLSVPAGMTGDFENFSRVEVDSEDLIALAMVMGGGGTGLQIRYLSFTQEQSAPDPGLGPGSEQQPDTSDWSIGRRQSVLAY